MKISYGGSELELQSASVDVKRQYDADWNVYELVTITGIIVPPDEPEADTPHIVEDK